MISIISRAGLDLHLLPEFPEGVFLELGCYRRYSEEQEEGEVCRELGKKQGEGPLLCSQTWPCPSSTHSRVRFPLLFPLIHQVQMNGSLSVGTASEDELRKNCNSISHCYRIPVFDIRRIKGAILLWYYPLWIKYGNLVSDNSAIFVTLANQILFLSLSFLICKCELNQIDLLPEVNVVIQKCLAQHLAHGWSSVKMNSPS